MIATEVAYVVQGTTRNGTTAWVRRNLTKRTRGVPYTADLDRAHLYATRHGARGVLRTWKVENFQHSAVARPTVEAVERYYEDGRWRVRLAPALTDADL